MSLHDNEFKTKKKPEMHGEILNISVNSATLERSEKVQKVFIFWFVQLSHLNVCIKPTKKINYLKNTLGLSGRHQGCIKKWEWGGGAKCASSPTPELLQLNNDRNVLYMNVSSFSLSPHFLSFFLFPFLKYEGGHSPLKIQWESYPLGPPLQPPSTPR